MFILKNHLINRPVIFLDRGFGMTPMNQGLRAVGTVELGGLKILHLKKGSIILLNAQESSYLILESTRTNG